MGDAVDHVAAPAVQRMGGGSVQVWRGARPRGGEAVRNNNKKKEKKKKEKKEKVEGKIGGGGRAKLCLHAPAAWVH